MIFNDAALFHSDRGPFFNKHRTEILEILVLF